MRRLFSVLSIGFGLFFFPIFNLQAESKVEKIGGVYEVQQIERKGADSFVIRFASTLPSGRFDKLVLESDHVHIGIEVGARVRLSAQILGQSGDATEVAQVLLFLPVGQSHVPVWMLSSKRPRLDMRGTRYLEMHAPSSDFVVF